MTTVTALARKPSVRRIPAAEVINDLQDIGDIAERQLISVYLPDAGAQVMYCGSKP